MIRQVDGHRSANSLWVPTNREGPLLSLSFAAAPAAGLPRLRLELVLQNLPIQRAAADIQNARRFLLVPLHPFEHADDVRTLGLGQRRESVTRLLQHRNC